MATPTASCILYYKDINIIYKINNRPPRSLAILSPLQRIGIGFMDLHWLCMKSC